MKTAKKITEYLVAQAEKNEQSMIHAVYVTRSEGYRYKMDALNHIRELMLRYEYYPDTNTAMKGIKEALEWVLEKENDRQ